MTAIQTDFFDSRPAPEPAARARRTDPETSHEAAATVDALRERQAAVLGVLRRGPATDEQLAQAYAAVPGAPKQSPSGLRTRRSELVEMGLARHSGAFGQTASGRRTRVWEAVP